MLVLLILLIMKFNNNLRKRLFAGFVFTGLITSSIHATTIIYDFDGDSLSFTTNTFANVTAGDISASGTGITAGASEDRLQRNLNGAAAATFEFTLTIGSDAINLDEISFTDGIDSGAGSNISYSQWDLAITRVGFSPSATPSTVTRSVFGSAFSSGSNTLSLSGLDNLANETVTFTFTSNYGTSPTFPGSGNNGFRHSFIDDLTITGAPVPEPTSTSLVALAGIIFAIRRRR